MRPDLHVHSSASDGTDPPAEVMRRAARAGLDAVALTDHDTVAGHAEARAAAGPVTLVPGMELSCRLDGRSVHMLAYLFDPDQPELAAELARIRDDRVLRARAMVDKLAVVADEGEFGGQFRLIRIEEVGQQVHGPAAQAARQLEAGEQGDRAGRGARLGVAGHGVVVGERHHVEADLGGAAHHLGGRIGPVRSSAVHMQVSTHQRGASRGRITGRAGAATRRRRAGPGPARDRAGRAGRAAR